MTLHKLLCKFGIHEWITKVKDDVIGGVMVVNSWSVCLICKTECR